MRIILAFSLIAAALTAVPSTAQDTKSGVDAWERSDYGTAVAIWRPHAIAGDADAQFNLAQAYRLGRGVAADMQQAETWYRRAADQGHMRAADNLGLILFQKGDRAGAMPMIRSSAERGEPRAQFVYATALFNGEYIGKNWPLAYAFMRRAAAAGITQAQTSLGKMESVISPADRDAGLALARELPARPAQEARIAPQPRLSLGTKIVPEPPAPRGATSPMGWHVQYGAFQQKEAAMRFWQQRLATVDALAGSRPDIVFDGRLTKVRQGPFPSRAEAARRCAAVRAAGLSCMLVPPAG